MQCSWRDGKYVCTEEVVRETRTMPGFPTRVVGKQKPRKPGATNAPKRIGAYRPAGTREALPGTICGSCVPRDNLQLILRSYEAQRGANSSEACAEILRPAKDAGPQDDNLLGPRRRQQCAIGSGILKET